MALGPRGFKRCAGHFWGFLETRPYMRARAGLAGTLLKLGDVDGALSHYRDMLKLNPNDNQARSNETPGFPSRADPAPLRRRRSSRF